MIRQFAGNNYSEETAKDKITFVNLMSLYVSIVGRNLIANNPRVMLSTQCSQYRPIVSAMQSWANQEIEHMRVAETMQRSVIDALFSIGICKVALATPSDAAVYSWKLQAGRPFISGVHLDDFVYDTFAHNFEEVGYIGHRYRVPFDTIKDSELYSKQRKDLTPSEPRQYNQEGDLRASMIGRGWGTGNREEFEDFVDLWEIYLPRHRMILTLPDDGGPGMLGEDEPLRAQKWIGPDSGPYHILGFGVVPGNAMPKAPMHDLYDMHDLANKLYRKLAKQAERQKETLLVRGGQTEDGDRILNVNDGEATQCDDPSKAVTVGFGGPNQQNFQMFEQVKALFSWAAGNLESIGGLSPQSKTLGQDRMLEESSSKTVQDLQERATDHVSSVVKSLCWYFHHDPYREMQVTEQIPGMPGMTFNRQPLTPQRRQQVPFEQMKIKIDPYSLPRATPQSRLQLINQVVQQMMPIMPMLQQSGIVFDPHYWLQKIGEYGDLPDITEMFTIQEPPQQGGESGGGGGEASQPPGMPPNTTRTYVRENMPGRTERGDSLMRQNAMLGIDVGGQHKNGQMNGVK